MSNNESFIRWQERSIQQLGFVNNLLIGLSTAIFIFQIKVSFDQTISLPNTIFCLFFISIIFIFLSITFGCITAWIRLKDFHLTSKIARKREKNKRDSINTLRERSKSLGSATWTLLTIQAIFFIFGQILLMVSALIFFVP